MSYILYLLRSLSRSILYLLLLLFIGSTGYRLIEGWTYLDSFYMTLITLTTVGFGEVHELSDSGKVFTMILLMAGVLFYALVINRLTKSIVEYRYNDIVSQIKMRRKIQNMNNHFIICGGGRMGLAIGKELEHAKKNFLFIESNPNSSISEFNHKWPIIHKDALLEETLVEARIHEAKGLASVLPTDADNLFVVLSARKLNPKLYIETRIAVESTRSKMLQAGADKVVSPYNAGGIQIARSFLNPNVEDFLSVVTDRASYDFEMKVHTVTPEDQYFEKTLSASHFRDEGYIVIGVRFPNGKMKFAPEAHFLLREGYQVYLMGPGKEDEDIIE